MSLKDIEEEEDEEQDVNIFSTLRTMRKTVEKLISRHNMESVSDQLASSREPHCIINGTEQNYILLAQAWLSKFELLNTIEDTPLLHIVGNLEAR